MKSQVYRRRRSVKIAIQVIFSIITSITSLKSTFRLNTWIELRLYVETHATMYFNWFHRNSDGLRLYLSKLSFSQRVENQLNVHRATATVIQTDWTNWHIFVRVLPPPRNGPGWNSIKTNMKNQQRIYSRYLRISVYHVVPLE